MKWLTCVDQINGTGTYPLSLRHVIATEDDAKVEALMGGGPS